MPGHQGIFRGRELCFSACDEMAQQGASKADLDADAEKDKKKKKQAEKADSETADSEDDSKKKKKNEEDEDEDEDEEEGSKAKKKKKEKKKRDFNLSPESEALQNEMLVFMLMCIFSYHCFFSSTLHSYALLSKETKDHKLAVVQFYINRIFKIDDVDQATHLDFYLKGIFFCLSIRSCEDVIDCRSSELDRPQLGRQD
jgi:cobalamin biosynthesis protein CobT